MLTDNQLGDDQLPGDGVLGLTQLRRLFLRYNRLAALPWLASLLSTPPPSEALPRLLLELDIRDNLATLAEAEAGLGRIVALYHRSSTLYRNR